MRANLRVGMGRTDEALPDARKAVELDPGFWVGWMDLGILLATRGQHEEVMDCAERAMAAAPWSPYSLGLMAAARHCRTCRESRTAPRRPATRLVWRAPRICRLLAGARRSRSGRRVGGQDCGAAVPGVHPADRPSVRAPAPFHFRVAAYPAGGEAGAVDLVTVRHQVRLPAGTESNSESRPGLTPSRVTDPTTSPRSRRNRARRDG